MKCQEDVDDAKGIQSPEKRTEEGEEGESSLLLSLEEKLLCDICRKRFYNPVHLPCGHIFCRECISQSIRDNPFCVSCKTPIRAKTLVRSTLIESICNSYEKISSSGKFQTKTKKDLVVLGTHLDLELNSPEIHEEKQPNISIETVTKAEFVVSEPFSVDLPWISVGHKPEEKNHESTPEHITSHTCAWQNEIDERKKEIENLLGFNKKSQNASSNEKAAPMPGSSEYDLFEEPTFTPMQFLSILPLKLAITYQTKTFKAICEECIDLGWISCSGEAIEFSDHSKILVVECNDRENKLTKRSILYLKCLLLGFYIVDGTWLEDSLRENKLLNFSDYEINGCLKSLVFEMPKQYRLMKRNGEVLSTPLYFVQPYLKFDCQGKISLLKGFTFIVLKGNNEVINNIYRETVTWMIKVAGGEVKNSNKRKNFEEDHLEAVCYVKLQFKPHKSIVDPIKDENQNSRAILSMSWLFDTISNGSFPPSFTPYIIDIQ